MSATSRLKRKLGDLGVDVSSSKANESFCLIGTPLPPLEKSRDTGEFVPLWKQEVRDEKGRRRLHGAFTGGFSAGYFNSVGSKEGWTPSTFVSSRSDRAKQKAARPEDFMDDEDLQDIRDSKKLVDKADEMDLSGGTAQPAAEDPDQSSLARALEAAMLPDAADSAGARILKKMGWKLGQGIGPRVTLRQRKLQEQLAKGQYATLDDIKITPEEEEADKHLYPPLDIPVLNVPRKDNSHGVGYHPGLGLNATLGVSERSKNSGPRISAGFGLGALNDADDDDVDIYDGGIEGMRRRTAYDGGDDDEHHASKPKAVSGSRPLSGNTTFRDGTRVLAGFTVSDKPVAEDRWFPLPDVPPGWTPDPRRVWKQAVSQEDASKENIPAPSSTAHRRFDITADERGKLLGETPLPAAPRSVFEFISQKDRERLKRVAAEVASGAPNVPPVNLPAARTEPHIAEAALKGFQPFTSDPVKQARYIIYLRSQASMDGSAPNLTPAPGQRTDEFHKELEDYAKAALIFKPISGAMAGRFTSAAVVEQGPKVHEGLHKPADEDVEMKEAEKKKAEEEKVSPKVHAARMEMYGTLTREVKPWQPARLLCKRFGVKDPDPPAPDPTETLVGNKSRFTSESEPSTSAAAATNDQDDSEPQERKKGGPRDLANIGLGEDDTQGQDTLTYQRPAMDVFKAIFASDDEDSDDEDAKEDKGEGPSEPPTLSVTAPNKEKDTVMEELPSLVPFANTRNDSGTRVDLTSFKPTFIPREGKSKESNGKELEKSEKKSGSEEKKSKKKKEKKNALVSFAMDEDGEDVPMKEEPRTHKKRRKSKNKGVEEEQKPPDDDDMWVEKPAPDIVKGLPSASMVVDVVEDQNPSEKAVGPPKGRKRAIDFM